MNKFCIFAAVMIKIYNYVKAGIDTRCYFVAKTENRA
jgi:hypothetical protein